MRSVSKYYIFWNGLIFNSHPKEYCFNLLKSKKKNSSKKPNNSTYKCLYGRMSYRFIELFSIIWSEFIECFCVNPYLISDIHCIVYYHDREYEADHKLITHRSIFESKCCCKGYYKSRVSRWHSSTSKHFIYCESSFESMNKTF